MKRQKVKVGVIGATGFTGEQLVELLSRHPYVEISYLSSTTHEVIPYSMFFPKFERVVDTKCEPIDLEKVVEKCEIVFLALPHTVSMEVVPYLLKSGCKVIDLSGDYRLKDTTLYKKYYGKPHKDEKGVKESVYGLSEFFRKEIEKTRLVANPGCYPTGILLSLLPLVLEEIVEEEVFVSSVSSVSGGGRKVKGEYLYSHMSNNIWAYKAFVHQHIPEIEQVLAELTRQKVKVDFVPHVIGIERGIYSTIYVRSKKEVVEKQLWEVYNKYYSSAFFVRVRRNLPRLKDVIGTNFCDIGFSVNEGRRKIVICCCIDNLIKGAAGNAVQNMNIMLGIEEKISLMM